MAKTEFIFFEIPIIRYCQVVGSFFLVAVQSRAVFWSVSTFLPAQFTTFRSRFALGMWASNFTGSFSIAENRLGVLRQFRGFGNFWCRKNTRAHVGLSIPRQFL